VISARLRLFVLAATAGTVALLAPIPAQAHDLKAEVNPGVDPIHVEAGFDDGTPAGGARVQVWNASEELVAAGTLDERGVWSFDRPGPGSYRIVVELAGHRDVVQLDVPEAATPVATSRWRLDKGLGLAIGLVLLLGGTVGYVLLRRTRKALAGTEPAADANRESSQNQSAI
jgi:hypothetical protein